MKTNRVCEILGISKPIVQAPMAWLTNAELVAAVGEAGGLGILGPNAGQTQPASGPEESCERMRQEVRKIKALTDKPFAITIIVDYDLRYTTPLVQMVVEEQVPVVLINGIFDEEIFATLKAHGIKIIFRPPNPTVENAIQAEAFGADIYVATGIDEGGSLPSQVIGSFSLIPMIADAIKMPIMVAGGVCDVRAVRAAFALGAEGVYAGSLFLATHENPAHPSVKQMIVDAKATDLLFYKTMPVHYRSLPTPLAQKLVEMDEAGASREEIDAYSRGGMREGMLLGNFEKGFISVGTGISTIKSIRSVREVIDDVMQDFA